MPKNALADTLAIDVGYDEFGDVDVHVVVKSVDVHGVVVVSGNDDVSVAVIDGDVEVFSTVSNIT